MADRKTAKRPGEPGNYHAGPSRPKGSVNAKTLEAREFAARIIDDPACQVNAIDRIKAGKADHLETLLWYYRYGKPKEAIDLTTKGVQLGVLLRTPLGTDPLKDQAAAMGRTSLSLADRVEPAATPEAP